MTIEEILVYTVAVVIAAAGLALYITAPRIKPNPFLGFRIGYVYVSRKLWVKANRIASIIMAIIAFTTIALVHIVGATTSLVLMTLELIASIVALTIYFEKLAEKELISIPSSIEEQNRELIVLEPMPPSIYHIAPPLVMLAILVIGILVYYPLLPQKVAVHFNIEGVPDRYASKTEATIIITLSITVVYSIYVFMALLGTRKPEAFYKPGLNSKTIRRIVNTLYTLLSITTTMVSIGMFDILYYNVSGAHIPLVNYIVMAFTALIVLSITRLALMLKKEYKKVKIVMWEKS